MTRDLGLLILRLTGGGLALAHGWGKVVNLSAGQGERFIAGVAELGFPAPLARGLFCLSRAVGILAHAWEQMQAKERNKGPIPRQYVWRYAGQPKRPVPDQG